MPRGGVTSKSTFSAGDRPYTSASPMAPANAARSAAASGAANAAHHAPALDVTSSIEGAILRRDTRRAELALDRVARVLARAALLEQERDDGPRERQRLFARDERDVAAEDVVELEPAGVVGGDDRRAAGERLDRNGRQRLENRRQDEEIGCGAVAGHDGIIHEPGKRDVTFDACRSRRRLQLAEERAGSADHQPGVGVRADDLVHRLDQEALPGERMQALHVHQQVAVGDPQRLAGRRLRRLVVPRELRTDRRIDGLHLPPRQAELARPSEQALAVEGHRRGRRDTRA